MDRSGLGPVTPCAGSGRTSPHSQDHTGPGDTNHEPPEDPAHRGTFVPQEGPRRGGPGHAGDEQALVPRGATKGTRVQLACRIHFFDMTSRRGTIGSMRVLLVEDDAAIARFVAMALKQAGYAVDVAESAERALTLVPDEAYDVAIVDIMLPGMDGLTLIEQCRGQGVTVPVLILSAKRSVDERVEGLQRGGDDYLTKPFAIAELLARVEALTRRQKLPAGGSVLLRVEDLELNLARRTARRGDRELDLSPREMSVLEYLCRNRGRVVTRAMILDHVWQMRFDPQTNVVDVYVHRLRRKVDQPGETPLIRTVRGAGYVLGA